MGRRLAEAECAVGVLDPRVEPRAHVRDGFVATFWTYYDNEPFPDPGGTLAPSRLGMEHPPPAESVSAADTAWTDYAEALARLHARMRRIDVSWFLQTPALQYRYTEIDGWQRLV